MKIYVDKKGFIFGNSDAIYFILIKTIFVVCFILLLLSNIISSANQREFI